MTRIFVKPTEKGLIVRDPVTKLALPDTGRSVPNTSYWRRRLKDGSIIKAKKPVSPAPKDLKK